MMLRYSSVLLLTIFLVPCIAGPAQALYDFEGLPLTVVAQGR
jgi:hypothetical protein